MFRPVVVFASIALCVGCDGGSDAVARDAGSPVDAAGPPDIVDGSQMADAAPRKGAGEACEAGECARGACVQGTCSALCVRDADCEAAAPRCVGRGGAGRCSVPCTGAEDCAPGLLCAAIDEAGGICVAPGPGGGGAVCAGREDCASWFCSGGQCLGACDGEGCAAGARCLPLSTQAVCSPTGAGAREALCGSSGACASGVCRGGRCSDVCDDGECGDDRICVRYPLIALCERRCADSVDCGERGVCLLVGGERICVTRGPGAAGDGCGVDAECASGVCALGQCAARCDDGGCAAGTACVRDIAGAVCRPAGPAPAGARCEGSALCATGFCAAGVCTSDCAEGGGCPVGTRCTAFAEGSFCFPACARDDDCGGPAFCDVRFAGGPTCFWRGERAEGEACGDHRECASGRCAGVCLARCVAECPAGQQCVDFGTGTFCVSEPLPIGAACDEGDVCADGAACVAGRCLPGCGGGCPVGAVCLGAQCHSACAVDADCRPGRGCDRVSGGCVDPGPGAVGAGCDDTRDCADGLCLDGRCRGRCAGGCAAGEGCVVLGDAGWCAPVGAGEAGAVCAVGGDCGSGLCLGRRCASDCENGCPAGTACRPGPGGAWCGGVCGFDAACAAGEVCARRVGEAEGACVVAAARVEACVVDGDCVAPDVACVDGRCRPPCRLGRDDCGPERVCAPRGLATLPDAEVGICRPVGAAGVLAACEADADCASGWCIEAYLDGRCGAPCADEAACAGRCVDLARDPSAPLWSCAPPCERDADCAAPLRCRRDLDGRGACF